jgi:hypothetical protein
VKSAYGEVDITVLEYFDTPFQHIFGEKIGGWFRTLAESKGVKFETGVSVLSQEQKAGV